MIAWRFMENLKCQASEFGSSFMVVRNYWRILRGSYTTTWRLCAEWIGGEVRQKAERVIQRVLMRAWTGAVEEDKQRVSQGLD